ncbi:MAG: hypothetical protein CMJ48_13500 [Planctomycetaceae bacterium]|nr:hypothetical protein [Planctomycetaceae bacterium]
MSYSSLRILIPSHSLEDFPTEATESEAAGLLNAFAVAWHPLLLASADSMPEWQRADEPPEAESGSLYIVPEICNDWLPHEWAGDAESRGVHVVQGISDRDELLSAVLKPFSQPVDAEIVGDFFALGTCYLQIELLTRHMHHYSDVDSSHFEREVLAAAEAALADDLTAAEQRLRTCFELLTEARERFYPVDCYLLDLCLLIPELADQHLDRLLTDSHPINFLVTPSSLQQITQERPKIASRFRTAVEEGRADVVGGELVETASPLLPLESLLTGIQRGLDGYHKQLGRRPSAWGRRRFGLSPMLPQILTKFGFTCGLHLVLDDGIYPDDEQSTLRWEGCDGSSIDAISRIPLAADSATTFLRFSTRLAESMEGDQVAGLIFARWPEVKTPWLGDFLRMQKYGHALGRFVTLDGYFIETDVPGRMSPFDARDYLSPFLTQAVARRESNPISRYRDFFQLRGRFDAGEWCAAVSQVLTGRAAEPDTILENRLEDQNTEDAPKIDAELGAALDEHAAGSARRLADVISHATGGEPGRLVINPLSFDRKVAVPDAGGSDCRVVDVPGSGFAWIADSAEATAPAKVPLAEENILRNEFFEVHLSETTGGIQRLKGYGRSPNRLSQQLAFRFPNERTISAGQGEGASGEKSYYSEMQLSELKVVSSGPVVGEIVAEGVIVDQQDESRLAGYRQRFRIWRNKPVLDVEIELDVDRMPEGDPWTNYFASRFAWKDSTAALTRSVLGGAHDFRGQRFESPHYLEIAADELRTTIVNFGVPFHRKTGERNVDTLLVTDGEESRCFGFQVVVDHAYPLEAALDAMQPPLVVPAIAGSPDAGRTGWFFHLSNRNVQLTRVLPLMPVPAPDTQPWEDAEPHVVPPNGFAIRLMETEGMHRTVRLRCFRTPLSARQRNFEGETIAELQIEGDCVLIDMTSYEIADVELRYE